VGENTNQIEQEIRQRREHLGRNLDELEDRARELADWRTHYRSHHGAFLGAAFGLGAVIGLMAIPRAAGPRRMKRVTLHQDHTNDFETHDSSHDPYRPRHAWREGQGTTARAVRQLGDTWAQIADALLRTASDKAVELVGNVVPGFRDHLEGPGPDHRVTH
jgi:hypothetical protein